MASEIRLVPVAPEEDASDVVATPEGDNEIAPDQPLRPSTNAAVTGLQTPRGSEPDPYKGE